MSVARRRRIGSDESQRRLVRCHVAGNRRRSGTGICTVVARASHQVHHGGAGGKLAGRARSHDRRQADCAPRPAGRRRGQARRRRHGSNRRGRESATRRLHDDDRLQRPSVVLAAVAKAAVRCPEGSDAGDHDDESAERAGRERIAARQFGGRARCLREGESREGQLRISRQWQLVASQHGALQADGRHRCSARAVQRFTACRNGDDSR